MIKMKLVKDKTLYVSYPNIGLVKQGQVVEVYKKFNKQFEELGFEEVKEEEKDKGVKE
jgi:hypothetical protein